MLARKASTAVLLHDDSRMLSVMQLVLTGGDSDQFRYKSTSQVPTGRFVALDTVALMVWSADSARGGRFNNQKGEGRKS